MLSLNSSWLTFSGYDMLSGEFPTWTESRWRNFGVRIFLIPSEEFQVSFDYCWMNWLTKYLWPSQAMTCCLDNSLRGQSRCGESLVLGYFLYRVSPIRSVKYLTPPPFIGFYQFLTLFLEFKFFKFPGLVIYLYLIPLFPLLD